MADLFEVHDKALAGVSRVLHEARVRIAVLENDKSGLVDALAACETQRVQMLASIEKERARADQCLVALEESVKLQSHYAELLNMHDNGGRVGFKDAAEWLARLEEVRNAS